MLSLILKCVRGVNGFFSFTERRVSTPFNISSVKPLVTRCACAACASATDVNKTRQFIQDGVENAELPRNEYHMNPKVMLIMTLNAVTTGTLATTILIFFFLLNKTQ